MYRAGNHVAGQDRIRVPCATDLLVGHFEAAYARVGAFRV